MVLHVTYNCNGLVRQLPRFNIISVSVSVPHDTRQALYYIADLMAEESCHNTGETVLSQVLMLFSIRLDTTFAVKLFPPIRN